MQSAYSTAQADLTSRDMIRYAHAVKSNNQFERYTILKWNPILKKYPEKKTGKKSDKNIRQWWRFEEFDWKLSKAFSRWKFERIYWNYFKSFENDQHENSCHNQVPFDWKKFGLFF